MNRHTARSIRVPEDWLTTLGESVAHLRARYGRMPQADDGMFMLGPGETSYIVLDSANECSHQFDFDHIPTPRELAACHYAVYAPHN